ncbi:NAD(P)H-quinone oxidoreductase [Alicyclobacillus sp. SO9]|uniref:NAD(P)H-quinone oxidoreductase n=1 Tax=Alicyclobacillus sp. SO9 TaxID=2665646 RepID=UPI0018E7EAD4|nr:NAD(P)H-quinone oxidoreductase [Alicyclobacillus sp. SO9]QQE78143.1 NAD(P)H-quinone oxidoreductase [Alicyclobacillus sp. SO9]
MKAVLLKDYGDTDVLYIGETPAPAAGTGELLVRVRATALNRADLLQRRGFYPPPKGSSEILGLEMAGEVAAVGEGVLDFELGDKVFGLLPGGGYAEYVKIPAGMAMRMPEGMEFEQAAAIPEVFLTAYSNLYWLGGLRADKRVLIHAGASGVGTAAIQLVREAGAVSFVTAGSKGKLEYCYELGAKAGWNYHDGEFLPFVKEQTNQDGVDLIFDFIGEPYFEQNLKALAVDGRLVIIGTLGGTNVKDVNLGMLLGRRLQVIGTALRSRAAEDKIRLTQEFASYALSKFESGQLKPIVDTVFEWSEVAKAHQFMEDNKNTGKIVLRIG